MVQVTLVTQCDRYILVKLINAIGQLPEDILYITPILENYDNERQISL